MKKLTGLFFTGIAVCLLTACSSSVVSDMNEEQNNIVAEYAADVILKYDRHYNERYREEETTPEEETFAKEEETAEQTQNYTQGSQNPSGSAEEASTVPAGRGSSIENILGLKGFSVTSGNYILTDTYPQGDAKDALFVMRAEKNSKLLIVTLKVKNTAKSRQSLNVMKCNARYKAVVNESTRLNAQITLLLDAFNTYEGTFKAGETKELVLVFQTAVQKKSDIAGLKLNISCGDRSGIITLK